LIKDDNSYSESLTVESVISMARDKTCLIVEVTDAGCLVLDVWCWVFGAGCLVLGVWCWMLPDELLIC